MRVGMNQNAMIAWLGRKRRQGMRSAAVYAMATLMGGVFVLALMICCIFVAAKTALLTVFPLSPVLVTIGSALLAIGFGGLIFADSIRAQRDDMSFLPGWLLREYVNIGPRLILEGWPHVLRARRFANLNLPVCAKVLCYLAGKAVPVLRSEVLRCFPDVKWPELTNDLKLVSGVIFFRRDEGRVTLTTPLRLELRTLLAYQQAAEPQPVPVEEPHKLSAAEILGVTPAASIAQIKTAYRSRVKECHPDRFAGMDENSRSLAEEWTKSLNAAYEFLIAETRGQQQTRN